MTRLDLSKRVFRLRAFRLFGVLGVLFFVMPGMPSYPAWAVQGQVVPEVRVLSLGGESFVARRWTARTGLPINQVTGLQKGEDGYLWLSTLDGLVRFDGMQFTLFNKAGAPDLPTARFYGLLGEANGSFWLESEAHHLVRFHNETFTDHTPELTGRFLALYLHDNGVWAGTETGLFRFDGVRFEPVARVQNGAVSAIHVDRTGSLWIGRGTGALERLDPHTFRVLERHLPESSGLEPIVLLAEDAGGAVWGASRRGTVRVAPDGVTEHVLVDLVGDLLSLLPPGDGEVGVLTTNVNSTFVLEGAEWRLLDPIGASRLRLRGAMEASSGSWSVVGGVLLRNGLPAAPAIRNIKTALLDHEGSVWGAGLDGLFQIRLSSVQGIRLEHDGAVYNAYTLHEGPSGTVWVAAQGPSLRAGLWRLEGKTPELVLHYPNPDLPARLEMGVLEDRRGSLWVALEEGGVCRLESFRCLEANREPMNGALVRGMFESRDGTLWFGTVSGVWGRRPDGSWFVWGPADGLPVTSVRAFAETPEGTLWMGTSTAGMIHWDGTSFEQISLADGLTSSSIRALYLDDHGTLWVGTEGRGVSVVRRRESLGGDGARSWEIKAIRQADGLFDDGVHQIVEDGAGRLWMSSNRGLFYVDRAQLQDFVDGVAPAVRSVHFDERDGLLNRELNGGVHGAGILTRAGDVYFPGMEGVARIPPDRMGVSEVPPQVWVESANSGGDRIVPQDGVIQLSRGSRDLEIGFAGLSFWSPQTMVFRFRLHGSDAGWREVVGRRSAFYTNLSGGRYRFEVLASTAPGVWSDTPAVVEVIVPYRAHEHPVLQAGVGILMLLGLFGFIHLRESRLRWQAKKLEVLVGERTQVVESQAARLLEMDRLKSRLFEDISHEFRTPLTLVLAPLENLREELSESLSPEGRRDIDLATHSAQRLLELVGQILDLARLEAGRLPLQVSAMAAAEWIEHQVLAFAPLAEQKEVFLRSEIRADLPVVWSSPDLIQKMLGNLISNAIKFTPEAGAVRVKAWADDAFLYVEVRDSGPGIPPDRLGSLFQRFSEPWHVVEGESALPSTRIGLSLAHQLAELHGGGIDVTSEEGFGATFTLKLRVGFDHFPEHVKVDTTGTALAGILPSTRTDSLSRASSPTGAQEQSEFMGGRPESTDGPAGTRPRVLVVEDHGDVRAYLQVLLGSRYNLSVAENGRDALNQMDALGVPDLIVSDLRMPEVDGMALLSAVRAMDQRRADGLTTPFLLISAKEDSMDRASAYAMGVSDFMAKPFSPRDLLARIEGLLATQAFLQKRRPVYQVSASTVDVGSQSSTFLTRLADVAEEHLSDPDFGITELASALGYSRSGLYRKLEEVGEASAAQIIQRMRLERAAQLLNQGTGSVSRVAHLCGFRTVSHFSRAFKARYGVPPSQFVDAPSTGTQRQ